MYPPNRWYGVFVPGRDLALLDQVTAPLVRRPAVGAYFVKLTGGFGIETLQRFDSRGLTPFLTLEPWFWDSRPMDMRPELALREFIAGRYDAELGKIAAMIAAFDKPVYLRLAHEMNGHWYPWAVGQNGNTAAEYIAFWNRVRAIFAQATKIRWVWACAAINNLRITAPDLSTVWPGDDRVDFAGTTGYGWDKDAATTYGKTFTKLATITERDFVIPEMGAQNGINQAGVPAPQWTKSLAGYLEATPRIRGFVWFHIGPEERATGDYRLYDTGVIEALNDVLQAVPIVSNTALRTPTGALSAAARDAINPTTVTYARNVINGHACDIKGPTRGLDKYGNQYECWVSPQGWARWRRV